MQQYLPLLLLLTCPVGMGLMMWFMMRRNGNAEPTHPQLHEELSMLRAQVDTLREEHTKQHDAPGNAS